MATHTPPTHGSGSRPTYVCKQDPELERHERVVYQGGWDPHLQGGMEPRMVGVVGLVGVVGVVGAMEEVIVVEMIMVIMVVVVGVVVNGECGWDSDGKWRMAEHSSCCLVWDLTCPPPCAAPPPTVPPAQPLWTHLPPVQLHKGVVSPHLEAGGRGCAYQHLLVVSRRLPIPLLLLLLLLLLQLLLP